MRKMGWLHVVHFLMGSPCKNHPSFNLVVLILWLLISFNVIKCHMAEERGLLSTRARLLAEPAPGRGAIAHQPLCKRPCESSIYNPSSFSFWINWHVFCLVVRFWLIRAVFNISCLGCIHFNLVSPLSFYRVWIEHNHGLRGIVFCESPIVFRGKCPKKTQMKRPLLNLTSLILRLSLIFAYRMPGSCCWPIQHTHWVSHASLGFYRQTLKLVNLKC